MSQPSTKEKAENLRKLHVRGDPLVLPNIWDPLGARILAAKGYPAVATASAAVGPSLGYQDGEMIGRSTLIDVLRRIAKSVDVPVTADIEAGYADSIAELQETAEQVIDAGVVGVNLEDGLPGDGGLRAVDEQCRRIEALRQAADRRGVPLVINGRIDSFLTSSFAKEGRAMQEALIRAKAYAAAGADCIYPIGPSDEATVRTLRERIEFPINILASSTAAPLAVLRDIGVERVSFGPFVFRALLRKFLEIADGLRTTGDYTGLENPASRAEVSQYLAAGHE